jgi:asparagine synthase (glutamine-hydrolysing)
LRPSLLGVDAPYDEGVVAAARARRAGRLLTGQGGDTVFFQMPTARLAGDLLRRHGAHAILSPEMAALSRWLHRSVWSMIREAALSPHAKGPVQRRAPDFLRREAAVGYQHPWLEASRDAAPAKQAQIAGLVHALIFHGPSQRASALDVVHPLLAQPLVEAALSTPSPWLVDGGRDRGLIRQAFAARLPQALIDRRTKGDLTAHYGRAIAAGLAELRPFLLEGRIARAGLIDRKRLAVRLDAEDLIWRGGYGELLVLAAVEAWLGGLATS